MALVVAWTAVAHAQAPPTTSGTSTDSTGEGPDQGDPIAAKAPPRPVITTDLPDVPARPPDRFAVMLFPNESGAKAMDWAIAAVPFALGEKVAHGLQLESAFGALVVPPGPAIEATPGVVAAFAKRVGAQWVFTGWVQRPQFELKIGVSLWKYDAATGTAAPLGLETIRRGPMADMHALITDAVIELAGRAKWDVPAGAREMLSKNPARDIYAYQLMGRGLGELVGATGTDDRKAAEHDLSRALLIDPKLPEGQRLMGELYATDPDPHVAREGRRQVRVRGGPRARLRSGGARGRRRGGRGGQAGAGARAVPAAGDVAAVGSRSALPARRCDVAVGRRRPARCASWAGSSIARPTICDRGACSR